MKLSGWIFMLVSWTAILGMFLYCIYRTTRTGRDKSGDD